MLIGQTCAAARVIDMVAGLIVTKTRSIALCEITTPAAVRRTAARVGWPCSISVSKFMTVAHLFCSRTSLLARTVVCAAVVIVAPVVEVAHDEGIVRRSASTVPHEVAPQLDERPGVVASGHSYSEDPAGRDDRARRCLDLPDVAAHEHEDSAGGRARPRRVRWVLTARWVMWATSSGEPWHSWMHTTASRESRFATTRHLSRKPVALDIANDLAFQVLTPMPSQDAAAPSLVRPLVVRSVISSRAEGRVRLALCRRAPPRASVSLEWLARACAAATLAAGAVRMQWSAPPWLRRPRAPH